MEPCKQHNISLSFLNKGQAAEFFKKLTKNYLNDPAAQEGVSREEQLHHLWGRCGERELSGTSQSQVLPSPSNPTQVTG